MSIATTFEFMYFTGKEFFGKLLEEKEIAIKIHLKPESLSNFTIYCRSLLRDFLLASLEGAKVFDIQVSKKHIHIIRPSNKTTPTNLPLKRW